MSRLALYEMRCTDSECKKISLQERSNEHENLCPYCGEFTDYAPGKNRTCISVHATFRKITKQKRYLNRKWQVVD
ncbi:hypothetical protein ACT7DO_09365 [Bacillus pacificus]